MQANKQANNPPISDVPWYGMSGLGRAHTARMFLECERSSDWYACVDTSSTPTLPFPVPTAILMPSGDTAPEVTMSSCWSSQQSDINQHNRHNNNDKQCTNSEGRGGPCYYRGSNPGSKLNNGRAAHARDTVNTA